MWTCYLNTPKPSRCYEGDVPHGIRITTPCMDSEQPPPIHIPDPLTSDQYWGPSYIYIDNMLIIHNNHRTESILRKKSNLICYHAMRESFAMGELLTTHIPTGDNCAESLTKVIYVRKRRYQVSNHNGT